MSVKIIGIRNSTDVASFLSNEWMNYGGMNNSVYYGVDMWKSEISNACTPYNDKLETDVEIEDHLSTTKISEFIPANWKITGTLSMINNIYNQTRGCVYVISDDENGGSMSERLYQKTELPENRSTWKSHISKKTIWIGDSVIRRCMWFDKSSSSEDTLSAISEISNPSGRFYVSGTNFANYYNDSMVL